jgi:hypothetical protein
MRRLPTRQLRHRRRVDLNLLHFPIDIDIDIDIGPTRAQ